MSIEIKQRLVEALEYPRYLIRTEMELENCPHQGVYNRADPRCQNCLDRQECQWLNWADEPAAIEQRPFDQLVLALGFAIESIECLMSRTAHSGDCHCEACRWWRRADALYSEVRCHPDLGPPPAPH